MMEAADLCKRDHRTDSDRLYGSRRRCVFLQRQMRPGAVIVGHVVGKHAPEMRLIQNDHMIEALAPDGSDQAFDISILPGARGARDNFVDAHPSDSTPKQLTIDGIAIP